MGLRDNVAQILVLETAGKPDALSLDTDCCVYGMHD